MKRRSKSRTAYWEMTSAELAAATKEFDKPLPPGRFKPLSRRDRARFERARQAGGVKVNQIYALGLDAELVGLAAAYAHRKKLTVTQVIERGVRGLLAFEN